MVALYGLNGRMRANCWIDPSQGLKRDATIGQERIETRLDLQIQAVLDATLSTLVWQISIAVGDCMNRFLDFWQESPGNAAVRRLSQLTRKDWGPRSAHLRP